jgi:hypothetical protein
MLHVRSELRSIVVTRARGGGGGGGVLVAKMSHFGGSNVHQMCTKPALKWPTPPLPRADQSRYTHEPNLCPLCPGTCVRGHCLDIAVDTAPKLPRWVPG